MSARYSNLWNICHTSRHYFRPVFDLEMSLHKRIDSALFRMDNYWIKDNIHLVTMDQFKCVLCSLDMT